MNRAAPLLLSLLACIVVASPAAGLAADADADGIDDAQDWCPNEPETRNGVDDDDGCPDAETASVVASGERIEIRESIAFAPASAKILAKSRGLLDRIARIMVDDPHIVRLRVEGHTDDRGDEAVNMRLSKARAVAVREALMERGVAGERLEAAGLGPTRPRADNSTPKGRRKNRRVELIVAETREAPRAALVKPREASIVVAATRGQVTVARPDGIEASAAVGMQMPNASRVKTGANGHCEVDLPSGARLQVRANSEITVRTKREGKRRQHRSSVRLVLGMVWTKITGAVEGDSQKYEVVTENAVAGVRGTVYQVSATRGPDGVTTSASAFSGTVAFAAGGREVALEAGMGITAHGDTIDGPHPLPPPPDGLTPYRGTFGKTVELRWNEEPELSYRVEVARDIRFAEIEVSEIVEAASYRLTVDASGDYFWRVRAVRNTLEGQPSQLFRLTLE